jgi:hypothetical protein
MSTLGQFRTAIAGELGLTNTTAGDQTQIDKWVNEGVADVVSRTRCKVGSATNSLSAGVGDYSIVGSMELLNVYVTFNGQQYPLQHVDTETLLEMRNASVVYTSPARYYAFNGVDLLMLWPLPVTAASATSPDYISFYYVPYPTTLSASADTPSDVPSEYHPAVEYYALYRGATFTDDTSSQMGAQYLQQYEMLLRRLKRRVALSGGRRLARARVADGRGFPYHDRSTYPGGSF